MKDSKLILKKNCKHQMHKYLSATNLFQIYQSIKTYDTDDYLLYFYQM